MLEIFPEQNMDVQYCHSNIINACKTGPNWNNIEENAVFVHAPSGAVIFTKG